MMKLEELDISDEFREKIDDAIERYRVYKEVIHYKKEKEYETVILSNRIHTLFLVLDFYTKYKTTETAQITADDVKIISKFI